MVTSMKAGVFAFLIEILSMSCAFFGAEAIYYDDYGYDDGYGYNEAERNYDKSYQDYYDSIKSKDSRSTDNRIRNYGTQNYESKNYNSRSSNSNERNSNNVINDDPYLDYDSFDYVNDEEDYENTYRDYYDAEFEKIKADLQKKKQSGGGNGENFSGSFDDAADLRSLVKLLIEELGAIKEPKDADIFKETMTYLRDLLRSIGGFAPAQMLEAIEKTATLYNKVMEENKTEGSEPKFVSTDKVTNMKNQVLTSIFDDYVNFVVNNSYDKQSRRLNDFKDEMEEKKQTFNRAKAAASRAIVLEETLEIFNDFLKSSNIRTLPSAKYITTNEQIVELEAYM